MTYFKPFGIFWVKINEKIIKIEINMAKNKTEKLEHKEAPRFKETEIGLIPEDWDFKVFSDIVDIFGGGTPKTTVPEYWDGEIPWLSVVDFNNDFRTVYETEKKITNLGLENSSTKLLKKGDLIISARGTVGAIAQLGKSMAFNQSCYGLRAKNGFKNDFVYYLLKFSLNILKQTTHGSTFDTITRNTFDLLKIPIPTPKEQYNIANILSTIDDKIEINNQINKNLEDIGQAIFRHWFVHFEFPDEEGQPYKSSCGRMVDAELGEIPVGWEVGKIKDLVIRSTDGLNPSNFPDKNFKHYSIPSYDSGKNPVTEVGSLINSQKFVVKNNSILVSKLNPDIPRIWAVKSEVEVDSVCSTEFQVLIPKNEIYSFVYYLFLSNHVKKTMIAQVTGTSKSHQRIRPEDMLNIEIVVPPMNIITKFDKIFNYSLTFSNKNLAQNQYLSNIRDSLIPKLMSGEIDISNVKI